MAICTAFTERSGKDERESAPPIRSQAHVESSDVGKPYVNRQI